MRWMIMLAVILFTACNQGNRQNTGTGTGPSAPEAPVFSADSAYAYVEQQLAFGPRIPGTPEQEACAAWLTGRLQGLADTVYVQRATVIAPQQRSLPCINIIAAFNPAAKRRILLLAHWDTRPYADKEAGGGNKKFDGADDGASGVAVLLEMARQFHAQRPETGIDILLTDVEDYGESKVEASYCLGAQYWAKNPHIPGYKADYGVLLDMVGGQNSAFYYESYSRQFAFPQAKMIWDVANRSGFSDFFRYEDNGAGAEDDHYYINTIAKIPTLDIIATQPNGNFMPHHHTTKDNISVINRRTMQAVGQTLLNVIYGQPFNY